ncbi:uncharacterized protein FIBRA_03867 [Fibroporia radiculosa]|uniref:Uncharacterized protein n=1 Tax=Fibroporia radiculosa TaxID=599839 RepID=J4GNQ5_9APHY|nr:uncharacterized protein FIBRA_03867 [Fibroporia radiculosa]CCM01800.1 predicted protein [Fibroporia radiculosa]
MFNPEHKYVSLMHSKSNLYASWEPLRPVRVGDYGRLQRDNSFSPEGNIFDKGLAARFGITTSDVCEDQERRIVAMEINEAKVGGNAGIDATPFGGGTIKTNFKVKKGYVAILVMLRPRHIQITNRGLLRDLIYSTAFPEKYVIVSEAYECRSYARLLAPSQEHNIEVNLDAKTNLNSFSAGIHLGWSTNVSGGDFKYALHEDEDAPRVQPLFQLVGRQLRGLRKLRRHRPVVELIPPRWRCVVLEPRDSDNTEIDDSERDTDSYDSDSTLW